MRRAREPPPLAVGRAIEKERKTITGWENNAIAYIKGDPAGKCPICGEIGVEIAEHVHGERKSLTLRCKACGSGAHFDGFAATGNS